MPTTKTQLKNAIRAAYDAESDRDIAYEDIDDARDRIAQAIADAIEGYVVGRQVLVTGVQAGGATATGTIQ